jgi:peptidoglycan/xylan/chitin deacetylase (PgdA/CDA1 family)
MAANVRRVTLTFDNGPTPEATGGVLDVLAERGIRSTFFVVGAQLRDPSRRALAERAAAEGHWIGNHTLSHTVQLGETTDPEAPAREIGEAQALLGNLARPERLYRPYGAGGLLGPSLFSDAAVRYLRDGGYTCVLWSSVPHDWDDPENWVERCLADVRAQDWPLVVLHDVPSCALPRLPELLDRLGDEGVEIVQELPEACVPIVRGELRGGIGHLVKENTS